jgi:N-acetylglucosamine-6-sulfatase
MDRSRDRGTRRTALAVTALLVAVGCTSGPDVAFVKEPRTPVRVTPVPVTAGPRPNILLITTDDQNLADLRWMPRTRRLLGRAGTTFTDAVSAHPLCCPARAQILTGQYAHNNGVRHNHGRWGGFKRLAADRTLATWLRDAGYRTGFVGKFLNEYPFRDPRPAGWSVWDPMLTRWYAYFGTTFARSGEAPAGYSVDVVADRTRRYLRRLSVGGRPFFLWASHVAPHATRPAPKTWVAPPVAPRHAHALANIEAPPGASAALASPAVAAADLVGQRGRWGAGYLARYHRQRLRSLRAVDEAVAGSIRTLDRLGELADTFVFFASDNGYLLGEHGLVGKNVLYRQALEIPLLARGPGLPRGGRTDAMVNLADLAATIVDVADARPTHPLDGRSMLPLLEGRQAGWRDTTLVLTGSERTGGPRPGWGLRGVRTARYTFGLDARTGDPVLFDRRREPDELRDLSGQRRYRAVVAELTRRTRALTGCSGRSCNRTFSTR